jgi:hypothetical protein
MQAVHRVIHHVSRHPVGLFYKKIIAVWINNSEAWELIDELLGHPCDFLLFPGVIPR